MNIRDAIEVLMRHTVVDLNEILYAQLVSVSQMNEVDATTEKFHPKMISPYTFVSRRETHWAIHAKDIDWALNGAIRIFWVFEDGFVGDAIDLGFLRKE